MAEEEKIDIKVEIEASQAQKTLGGLEGSIDKLKELQQGEDIGSKAFNDLGRAIQKAENKIKDVDLAFESLDFEQKLTAGSDAIVGIAGGFAAAEGAAALFGAESEALEKTLAKVAGALALTQGLRDLANGAIALKKLGVAAEIARKAQAALNKSILANPFVGFAVAIGAVVGLLASMSKESDNLVDVQKRFNEELAKAQAESDLLFSSLQNVTKGTKEHKSIIEKINTTYGPYLDNLITEESTLEDIEKAQKLVNTALQKNIAIKIRDEETQESRTNAIRTQKDFLTDFAEALRKEGKTEAEINEFRQEAIELINKKTQAEIENKKSLEERTFVDEKGRVIVKKASDEAIAATKALSDEIFSLQERSGTSGFLGFGVASGIQEVVDVSLEAQRQIKQVENSLEFFINADTGSGGGESTESRLKELQKLLEINRQKAEELTNEFTRADDKALIALNNEGRALKQQIDQIKERLKLEKEEGNNRKESINIEVEALQRLNNERASSFEKLQELLQQEIDAKESARQQEVLGVQKEFEQKLTIQQQYFIEANRLALLEIANEHAKKEARLELASATIGILNSLQSLAKEGSAAQKTLAIAEIAAQTGVGFIQGLIVAQKAAAGTGPAAAFSFPIFYASQIGAVLAAAAKAKGILGASSGGVSAPSFGGSIGGATAGASGSQINQVSNTATLLDQSQQNLTQRVVVLESDITGAQDSVTAVESLSTF